MTKKTKIIEKSLWIFLLSFVSFVCGAFYRDAQQRYKEEQMRLVCESCNNDSLVITYNNYDNEN